MTMIIPTELITRRRRQLLVHSYLYYRLDTSVISDERWQQWANELVDLQKEYGYKFNYYDDAFKDWDGSTGYHLPLDDVWIKEVAKTLIKEN